MHRYSINALILKFSLKSHYTFSTAGGALSGGGGDWVAKQQPFSETLETKVNGLYLVDIQNKNVYL